MLYMVQYTLYVFVHDRLTSSKTHFANKYINKRLTFFVNITNTLASSFIYFFILFYFSEELCIVA